MTDPLLLSTTTVNHPWHPPGAKRMLAHCANLSWAFLAELLCRAWFYNFSGDIRLIITCWSSSLLFGTQSVTITASTVWADTSSGISLTMGLFVCPVLVQMLAAHTRPSPVQQLVSTEYLIHHHVQAQCPLQQSYSHCSQRYIWWNSLRKVKYLFSDLMWNVVTAGLES